MQTNTVEQFEEKTTGDFINPKPFLNHLANLITEIYLESYKTGQNESKYGKDPEWHSGV